MFRQRSDYLWTTCSCVQFLPLADRAVIAWRVKEANDEARAAEDQRRDREARQVQLRAAVRNVLGATVDTSRAEWMTPECFGPAVVEDFAFAIAFPIPGSNEHHLVLLTEDEEIQIDTLEGLGALLKDRSVAGIDFVADHRARVAYEADPQPLSFHAAQAAGRLERVAVGPQSERTYEERGIEEQERAWAEEGGVL